MRETARDQPFRFNRGRAGYLYVIDGAVTINGEKVTTGDAVKISDESSIALGALQDSELILLDIPLDYDPVGVWAR